MRFFLLFLALAAGSLQAQPAEAVLPGDSLEKAEQLYGPLADLGNLDKSQLAHPPKAGKLVKKDGKVSIIIRGNRDFGDYKAEMQISLQDEVVVAKQYTLQLGVLSKEEFLTIFEDVQAQLVKLFGEADITGGRTIETFGEDFQDSSLWDEEKFYLQKRIAYDEMFGSQIQILFEDKECPEDARCSLKDSLLVNALAVQREEGEHAVDVDQDAHVEKFIEEGHSH